MLPAGLCIHPESVASYSYFELVYECNESPSCLSILIHYFNTCSCKAHVDGKQIIGYSYFSMLPNDKVNHGDQRLATAAAVSLSSIRCSEFPGGTCSIHDHQSPRPNDPYLSITSIRTERIRPGVV
jgi:hypothetical protein